MYVITIGQRSETRTTLAGVLQLLNDDRGARPTLRLEDVSLRHIERGSIPVVRLSGRNFGVRPPGTARTILSQIIDEVDRFIVRIGGKVLRPHEMTRASWGAVVAAGRLAFFPEEVVEMAHPDAAPLIQTTDLFDDPGSFDIAAFVQAEFKRRFGFGTNGPPYDQSRSSNARHEVHVAYALLRGETLRNCVVHAYRENPDYAANGLEWMNVLIAVPALRGALTETQTLALCRAMRGAKLPLTTGNAPKLLAVMRRCTAEATDVEVDDLLFEAGVLPPLTAPTVQAPSGEDARPVSALAERIHHLITQRQFNETMGRAKADREAMRISQRRFDDVARRAVNARLASGFGWANKVALAVLQRDIASVLKVFDGPKDWNVDSKRAVRDVLGIDLLNCAAALRRQRLFEMCGFSADEQAHWERQAAADQAQRLAARDFDEACKTAEQSRWRLDNGRVLNGREYVDLCIAEGYSTIIDRSRGRAREYFIHDARRGYSRRLRAKDGTLSYARARLSEARAPAALAA